MPYKLRLWKLSSSACHNNCRACCHSPDLPRPETFLDNPMGKSHGEVNGFVVFEVRKVTKKSKK